MQTILAGLRTMQTVPTEIAQRESIEVGLVPGKSTAGIATVKQDITL